KRVGGTCRRHGAHCPVLLLAWAAPTTAAVGQARPLRPGPPRAAGADPGTSGVGLHAVGDRAAPGTHSLRRLPRGTGATAGVDRTVDRGPQRRHRPRRTGPAGRAAARRRPRRETGGPGHPATPARLRPAAPAQPGDALRGPAD